jgi:hypothetical protein
LLFVQVFSSLVSSIFFAFHSRAHLLWFFCFLLHSIEHKMCHCFFALCYNSAKL